LNSVARQIVGVMRADFAFPINRVQFWIPARRDPSVLKDYWGGMYVPFVARLHPGVTLPQAASVQIGNRSSARSELCGKCRSFPQRAIAVAEHNLDLVAEIGI
jgi:hypothetical protein